MSKRKLSYLSFLCACSSSSVQLQQFLDRWHFQACHGLSRGERHSIDWGSFYGYFMLFWANFGSKFDCKFMASMAILVGKMMINPGLAPSFSQTHIRLCCRSDGKFTLCKFFLAHTCIVCVFSHSLSRSEEWTHSETETRHQYKN